MPGRRQRKAASVDGLFRVSLDHGASAPAGWLAGSEIETLFGAKKDVAMTGKDAPPEVKIRSYRDSPICDVVVVVHGTEMVLRCPDYRQAMRWARQKEIDLLFGAKRAEEEDEGAERSSRAGV